MNRLLKVFYIILFFALITVSCKRYEDFATIKQDQQYTFSHNNKLYYVVIDSVANRKHLTGRFARYQDQAIVPVEKFAAVSKKNSLTIRFPGEEVTYKVDVDSLTENKISLDIDGGKIKKQHITISKQEVSMPDDVSKRYKEKIFDNYSLSTEVYGRAKGYYTSKVVDNSTNASYLEILKDVGKGISSNFLMDELEIKMDIYEPKNDTLKKRPLLMLIHGGAFLVGDKNDVPIVSLAEHFAKSGYTVASINYRLGFIMAPYSYGLVEREMHRALQDCRAALRYLIHNAEKYHIDTSKVFIGGSSAGAINSLNLAFIKEDERFESSEGSLLKLRNNLGCLDCSTNDLKEKFSIDGVINLWGAVNDIEFIDKDEMIPVISIHGNDDQVVPIGHDYPYVKISEFLASVFSNQLYGSQKISEKLSSYGIKNRLIVLDGTDHDPFYDEKGGCSPLLDTIKKDVSDFMVHTMVLGNNDPQIEGDKLVKISAKSIKCFVEKNDSLSYFWNVTNGIVLETENHNSEANLLLFKGQTKYPVTLIIQNSEGYTVELSDTIRIVD